MSSEVTTQKNKAMLKQAIHGMILEIILKIILFIYVIDSNFGMHWKACLNILTCKCSCIPCFVEVDMTETETVVAAGTVDQGGLDRVGIRTP